MHDPADPASLGERTLAIHAGESPDPVTHASTANLAMSTSFVVDRPMSFSASASQDDEPYFYGRWGNPTVRMLETKLAALEGAEDCRTYASGMAATAALMMTVLSTGDRIVVSDVTYAGTAELVRQTMPRMGIDVVAIDTSDLDQVRQALGTPTRLVWVETPANPILKLTDIAAVARLAHDAGAELAVDSTFATPMGTRPISLGADYVVHSLTKYIGGHGDAIGGAVLGSTERMAALGLEATVHFGGVLSPFNAWLIARGAATLPLRMQAHQAGATAVATALSADSRVRRVLYPGLDSHPQHDLAVTQMQNFSGMVSFQVEDGAAVADRMMSDLRIIHYAVSLGHHRSLVYWLPTDAMLSDSYGLEGAAADAYRKIAGDGVFRLSVGLEDPEDLLADLDRVL